MIRVDFLYTQLQIQMFFTGPLPEISVISVHSAQLSLWELILPSCLSSRTPAWWICHLLPCVLQVRYANQIWVYLLIVCLFDFISQRLWTEKERNIQKSPAIHYDRWWLNENYAYCLFQKFSTKYKIYHLFFHDNMKNTFCHKPDKN